MPHCNLPRLACFTSAALAGLAAALITVPAGAALIMHKDLSLDVAKTVAEGAVAACAAKGYAVSAVVVNRDGDTIVAMRGDDASPHTLENARRKAYTAMRPRSTPRSCKTRLRWRISRSRCRTLSQSPAANRSRSALR